MCGQWFKIERGFRSVPRLACQADLGSKGYGLDGWGRLALLARFTILGEWALKTAGDPERPPVG